GNCSLTYRPRQFASVTHKLIGKFCGFRSRRKHARCSLRRCYFSHLFNRLNWLTRSPCPVSFCFGFCSFAFCYQTCSLASSPLLLFYFLPSGRLESPRQATRFLSLFGDLLFILFLLPCKAPYYFRSICFLSI